MTKFVAVSKMSKKAKKEFYAQKRTVWTVNPASFKMGKSSAEYKAKKASLKGV